MKKLFAVMLCLLALCGCGEATPVDVATTDGTTAVEATSSMEELYSAVIADAAIGGGLVWPVDRDWRDDYALYDTDGNGTMALLLGIKNSYGRVREIYTFQNGVAERKLSADNPEAGDSSIYILKTGYIYTEQFGVDIKRFYRFEDGQLKFVMGLGSYINGGPFRVDPTGGEKDFSFGFGPDDTKVRIKPIEYGKYRRLYNEFLGERDPDLLVWEPAELDWKPLAEWGIE